MILNSLKVENGSFQVEFHFPFSKLRLVVAVAGTLYVAQRPFPNVAQAAQKEATDPRHQIGTGPPRRSLPRTHTRQFHRNLLPIQFTWIQFISIRFLNQSFSHFFTSSVNLCTEIVN